jgi:hypothetical protein
MLAAQVPEPCRLRAWPALLAAGLPGCRRRCEVPRGRTDAGPLQRPGLGFVTSGASPPGTSPGGARRLQVAVPRAEDGNRTRTACLEGRDSTVELHPHCPVSAAGPLQRTRLPLTQGSAGKPSRRDASRPAAVQVLWPQGHSIVRLRLSIPAPSRGGYPASRSPRVALVRGPSDVDRRHRGHPPDRTGHLPGFNRALLPK